MKYYLLHGLLTILDNKNVGQSIPVFKLIRDIPSILEIVIPAHSHIFDHWYFGWHEGLQNALTSENIWAPLPYHHSGHSRNLKAKRIVKVDLTPLGGVMEGVQVV